jgi:putative phage-type endonuclease
MILQTEATEAEFSQKEIELNQWLEERKTYLGASDISAILGLNDYASPVDVYLSKTEGKESEDNDFLRAGRALEPAIIQLYREDARCVVEPNGNRIYRLQDFPFIGCTPDAWILDQSETDNPNDGLLEIKNTSKWITDVNPCHYAQLQYQLGVTGAQWGVLCYLVQGFKLVHFDFTRDEEVIKNCFSAAKHFWNTHIIPRIAPEPSKAGDTLKLFPNSYDLSKVNCAEETYNYVVKHRELKKQEKELKKEIETNAEHIKAAMKDAEALFYDNGSGAAQKVATWKQSARGRIFKVIGED